MRRSIVTTRAADPAPREAHGRQRPRAGLRTVAAFTAAALLSVTAAGAAVADDIYNTIDGNTAALALDAAAESMVYKVGDTTPRTTSFRLMQRNSNIDGWNGCNATTATPARFVVSSSNPAVASVTVAKPTSKGEMEFTACTLFDGSNAADTEQKVSVQPLKPGTSTITVAVAQGSPAPGSFNLTPATFVVTVDAPPPTPPVVQVLGLTQRDYVKGSPPDPSCRATHPDTNKVVDFPAIVTKAPPIEDGIGTWNVKCSYVEAAGVPAVVKDATYELIDITPPAVSYKVSSPPDGNNGWYRKEVVLQWAVTEAQSPFYLKTTGCEEQRVVLEQTRTYTCLAESKGGKAAPVEVPINRDATPPAVDGTIVSEPIDVNGVRWYADKAEVAWTSTDALSGVESSWSTVGGQLDAATKKSVVATEGRNQLARVVARDLAGNTGGYSVQFINVDGSAPVVQAAVVGDPTPSGWYKDRAVVDVKAADPEVSPYERGSGLKTDPTKLYEYTASGTHTYTATDHVGHDGTSAAVSFKVDATDPVVAAKCPPSAVLNNGATATWTATDAESGVAGPSEGSVTLDTRSVGPKIATVPAGAALDNVGHASAAAGCGYDVHYDFKGFFSPVDNGGVYNQVKAGSAVPVKFSLGGNQGLSVLNGTPAATRVACPSDAPVDLLEQTVPVTTTSGLKYDALANQYNYTWKTAGNFAGTCQKLTVKLADGTSKTALFKFVR